MIAAASAVTTPIRQADPRAPSGRSWWVYVAAA
jgi:hypothetical protein